MVTDDRERRNDVSVTTNRRMYGDGCIAEAGQCHSHTLGFFHGKRSNPPKARTGNPAWFRPLAIAVQGGGLETHIGFTVPV